MRLSYGLHMQQTQRLLMTPALRQALSVLQLPVAELEEFVTDYLLGNPCVEIESIQERREEPISTLRIRQLIDYFDGSDRHWRMGHDAEEAYSSLEMVATASPTLYEYLSEQLRLAEMSKAELRIGAFLIGNLDDHGYLAISLAEAASRLGYSLEQVMQVLRIIQGFDPPGVGARSLQECLTLQWDQLGEENPLVPLLIEHYLKDLGAGRIAQIADAVGATQDEVKLATALLQKLDPKPGIRFGGEKEVCYLVPDVIIERVGQEYVVLVNDGRVPVLTLNHQYRRMLAGDPDPALRRFIEEKIHDALRLVMAIEKRRWTLHRVTEAILQCQRDFFDNGPRHLCPLTLRQVAAMVEVHESTVSRATAGKYLQTPRGLYPFKFFFSSGVESDGGKGLAQESVKRMIAEMIECEKADTPLSDQQLTNSLNSQGVHISRRTVTKYREDQGIPSSGRRRRDRTGS